MADAFRTGPVGLEIAQREHPFDFRGSGGEYFRIWIVNFFLTLITLGIYSAWAKVRTERYFASSTHVAGSSFDYLANPLAILKGRLIVLGFFALYAAVSSFAPLLEPFMIVAVVLLIPWALVRSMAFRAHNTAWRSLRFHFRATYGNAFAAYMGLPLLGVLTLGILYPYAIFRQRRFIVDHASFGTTPFEFGSNAGDFYRLFLGILALLLVVSVGMGALSAALGEIGFPVFGLLVLPIYFYGFGYFAAGITNLTYDGAKLGGHRLSANLPAAGVAWVYATNALAMLLSLGLLIPWAQVRLARYRLGHIRLHTTGDLDAFIAAQAEEVASLGAEFGEALDLDLGL